MPVLSLRVVAHQDLSLPLPLEGRPAACPPISFAPCPYPFGFRTFALPVLLDCRYHVVRPSSAREPSRAIQLVGHASAPQHRSCSADFRSPHSSEGRNA